MQLLEHLKSISARLVSDIRDVECSVDALLHDTNVLSTTAKTEFHRFNLLANQQFIENVRKSYPLYFSDAMSSDSFSPYCTRRSAYTTRMSACSRRRAMWRRPRLQPPKSWPKHTPIR